MSKRIPAVANAFSRAIWAMEPEKLRTIAMVVESRLAGVEFSEDEIRAAMGDMGEEDRPRIQRVGSVAVVPVYGVLTKRANMMTRYSGGTSVDLLARDLQALGDDSTVEAVVLDCNSPGGECSGVADCAEAVAGLAKKKRVVAVANDLMASGAYWICSAANEIVATKTSLIGSIGVYSIYQEFSKYLDEAGVTTNIIQAGEVKVAGNEYRPMTPAEREAIQQRVDDCYGLFIEAVAKNRNMANASAKGLADGAVHYGQRAVDLGLADRIGTLDETVATVARGSKTAPTRRMSMSTEAAVTGSTQSETPPVVDNGAAVVSAAEAAARQQEQNRILEIQSLCSAAFGAGSEKATKLSMNYISSGMSLDQAQSAVGRHPVNSPADGGYSVPGSLTAGTSSREVFYSAARDAVLLKVGRLSGPEGKAVSPNRVTAQLANLSLLDIARESLRQAGQDVSLMSRRAIAEAAIQWEQVGIPRGPHLPSLSGYGMMVADGGSLMRTGDFPGIFRDAANKILLDEWRTATGTWRRWVKRASNVPDMKEINRLKLSEIPMLELVKEDHDFPKTRMSEEREAYRPARYARAGSVPFEMILNDDLDAFASIPVKMARGTDRTINYLAYAELTSNRTMSDGIAVFDSQHGNLISSGAGAPSAAQMQSIRNLMRRQKALQNTDDNLTNNAFLNLEPKIILIPPQHEMAAQELQMSFANPDQLNSARVNVWANQFDIVSDAELLTSSGTSNIWYALTDPNYMRAVEITFVEGFDSPVIEESYDFDRKGRKLSVQTIFGVRWIEWRAAVRNNGA
ncbi:MAG: signal peptide peptidase SppA [Proteobacteria bacterium]|nr:signal peptide peptidase SppA [Pseudomonadota bacterium]